ncbi:cytochrome P450 94C1 [Henckelia pumila]|uniref:cytochrome P450 94C1 n=1 Tax=Henckelia pumila TaxID=405737 RepID=UPI003C6E94F4
MAFESPLQLILGFVFFTFSAVFFVFSVFGFVLRLKPWCGCEICQSFLTSSWSLQFDNLCDWYSHLLANSPTGTIHVHVLNNVITANADNVEHMLKTKFHNYPKGKPFSTILGDLLGRGIFNVDGDLWKFQRKMASLELGSFSVRSYAFQIVTSEIQSKLIPLMSHQARNDSSTHDLLDLQDVFRRFSFDTICRFSFGLDLGCLNLPLPISEFESAFDLATRLSAERAITASPIVWKIKRFFNLGKEKQLKQAIKSVNDLAREVIKHKRNHQETSSNDDLLSRFMANIDDDDFLRDIVVSFLIAGRDTVASSLTSFFWLLSKNPSVIQSIIQESDRIMGSAAARKCPSFNQLREMHYLQAAVHESLRLFPPVQFDSKFSEADDVLPDGTMVSGGARVTYHPYAMGRMERIWGHDFAEFKPERWLENGVFKQANPFKYPVFQAGPRVCLGKEIALVEMKTVALSLIRKFDIQVATADRALKFGPGITATVRGGLPVIVRERYYN